MSNQKALNAITKIKKAIDKFGSNIELQTQEQSIQRGDPLYDRYDPANNLTPATLTAMKALVSSQPSKAISALENSVIGSYNLAMRLYTTVRINKKAHKIIYDGDEYEITYISKIVLQNETLMYEILVSN